MGYSNTGDRGGYDNLKEEGGYKQTPSILFLFLIAALLINLIVVIYPLVIEGIIIGAPPPIDSSLDWWFVRFYFGDLTHFPYDVFIPVLLVFYAAGFVFGFLIPLPVFLPTFRKLAKSGEVTIPERRLAAKAILDLGLVFYISFIVFDPILATIIHYPPQLPGFTPFLSHSFIYFFAITGFATGNSIGKSIFPLWVIVKCKRSKLRLETHNFRMLDAYSRPKKGRLIKWVLTPAEERHR